MNAFATEWGNIASVLGLLVSIVGLGFSVWAVYAARGAKLAAESAAESVRARLSLFGILESLSLALAQMQELKLLQRTQDWAQVLSRYANLRVSLARICAGPVALDEREQSILSDARSALAANENRVDRALLSGKQPADPAKLNEIVSSHIDACVTVLVRIQTEPGGKSDCRSTHGAYEATFGQVSIWISRMAT